MDHEELGSKIGTTEINDAAQLWEFLKSSAGLDLKYYDKQMLDSYDPDLNLYSLLGISCDLPSVEENLAAGQVTLERLLEVLLTAFHPYSRMMNEICRFFAKYEIKYADENIKMEFDFDSLTEDMRFDLESFREMVNKYHLIEVQISAYEITASQINELYGILRLTGSASIKNVAAKMWTDSYIDEKSGAVFKAPDLKTPITGHPDLDRSLEILMSIWRSFVNNCLEHGRSLEDLKKAANWNEDRGALEQNVNVLTDIRLLCRISLDHWAKFFIVQVFSTIEEIEQLDAEERNLRFNGLSDILNAFVLNLNRVTVTVPEKKVTEQLKDILNLPVWKFRYELYAAWILTKIDKSFDGYQVMLHHKNGKLSLPFKANLIATIKSAEGDFELWSEVRSALANPSGSKRKAAIQPDYRIFFSADDDTPENHFVAIEVKQYRNSNKKNFSEAMNDYARGLPKAEIFLVNYGPVKDNMYLEFPERCTYMGQIRPDDLGSDIFEEKLLAVLPLPDIEGLEHYLDSSVLAPYLGCPVDEIYVDISASLESPDYKSFLKVVLNELLRRRKIVKVAAVDSAERYLWKNPNQSAVEQLTDIEFKGSTDFTEIIRGVSRKKLIITDLDGYRICVRNNVLIGGCLIYHDKKVDFQPLSSDLW
ncbi:hypothetical protein SD960_02350 [Flavobacterium sp. MMLR14_040]|uniref:hypothetical protein n=1 Tax=Flavobacterium sp. MMLR14_040 TaxID=3093843 RepID=UPI0029907C99|nr:hypothetical protein [Flavobacterium sp. MMLR14_040]MDW8848919.1 hypothetical protein [Flavobacterium sp. MMLR14_040]